MKKYSTVCINFKNQTSRYLPEPDMVLCSADWSVTPELAVWGIAVVPSAAMAPSLPVEPTLATLPDSDTPSP